MENSLSAIKQPAPTLSAQAQTPAAETKKPKRTINRPHVGVVDVPQISSTPIKDELVRKERENPREIINFKTTSKKNLNFQGTLSGIIGACGVVSLVSLIRKIKH